MRNRRLGGGERAATATPKPMTGPIGDVLRPHNRSSGAGRNSHISPRIFHSASNWPEQFARSNSLGERSHSTRSRFNFLESRRTNSDPARRSSSWKSGESLPKELRLRPNSSSKTRRTLSAGSALVGVIGWRWRTREPTLLASINLKICAHIFRERTHREKPETESRRALDGLRLEKMRNKLGGGIRFGRLKLKFSLFRRTLAVVTASGLDAPNDDAMAQQTNKQTDPQQTSARPTCARVMNGQFGGE